MSYNKNFYLQKKFLIKKMGARNINALNDDNNNRENINDIINVNEEVNPNQQNLIPIEEQNQIVQERAISKKILSVRLPTNLDKKTLSLEQDYLSSDKSYIKFNYDSLYDLDCYINFNVTERSDFSEKNKKHRLAYAPSPHFSDRGYYIPSLKNGEQQEFYNKETFIDIKDFYDEKVDNQNSYDICIEFVPLFPPGSPEIADNNEIVFVTLCNLERHQEENTYLIKCVKQRIRTHKIWIDLYDIFDSALEGGLCLICCSEKRNTIFLPCKHACCCNKCGSEIKYRFKPCPICKTPIDDLLIVNSDEKKIKIENEDDNIESSENFENNIDNDIINTGNNKNDMINDSNAVSENNANEEDVLIPVNIKENNDKEEIKEIEEKEEIKDNEGMKENEDNDNNNEKNNNIYNDVNEKKEEEIINIQNNKNIEDNEEIIENNYVKIEDHDNK